MGFEVGSLSLLFYLGQFLSFISCPTSSLQIALDTLRSHFSAVYDLTIMYESAKGHSVREPPPSMFGK